jgi:putative hydrolase of the HAD superfamily
MQAVIFDLDDTLILDEAATRAAFAEAAKRAGIHGADIRDYQAATQRLAAELWKSSVHHEFCERIGINDAECLWGEFGNQTAELRALGAWARKFRMEVFDRALREQVIENVDAAAEIARVFSTTRIKEGRLLPDTLETLARLQPKYRLGMLTNGAPDLQRDKVQRAALESFFQAIVVSGDHPVGKPDPAIFHYILQLLGTTPQQAVMVGNSMTRDIQGARAAGICAVWLHIPGAEEPADCEPDYTITSLFELPSLLESLDTLPAT